ncbi:uncharacterized protein PSFLO_02859 [Pseudozyma flocculosa]|uniref:Uncharacterized protein n=1 Tax=Pseudozyma flocculosa TaxID=84751 RepID=A0A5C3F0F2_9BASI|nr:uncharacterized protein PSFLO_02859 [Pseudozyma flocculosa]
MSNTSHVAPVDLDSWNISLFPEDLLGLLTPETPLELVSHSSVSILRDDPFFKDWVFAGDIHGHIRIHPSYKAPLVQSLQGNNLALEISPFPTALILGLGLQGVVPRWSKLAPILMHGLQGDVGRVRGGPILDKLILYDR